jgi:hypothetical protein
MLDEVTVQVSARVLELAKEIADERGVSVDKVIEVAVVLLYSVHDIDLDPDSSVLIQDPSGVRVLELNFS